MKRVRSERAPARWRSRGWLSLAAAIVAAALTPAAAGAQAAASCSVEYAPMRDGVRLATEVYRPADPGRYPVVLMRPPFNRTSAPTGSNCNSAAMQFFAEHGYVALNQDVRGIYRSEGRFNPMVQEARDGYDAVEWAAAQPWSTGRVGMYGGSYVGLTQWQAAMQSPPHLAAIVPWITASDYHDNWTYVNGVFDLWFAQSWNQATFAPETLRLSLLASGQPPAEVERRVAEWYAQTQQDLLTKWVWQLPLRSFTGLRGIAPWSYVWLRHPTYDRFWARLDVERGYQRVKVPVLNIGGWYDIFQVGTVRNFLGMRSEGGTPEARAGTKLIMRASAHAPAPGASPTGVGDVDFGPGNTLDLNAESLRFYDYLKGLDNGAQDDPPVRLFVMVPPDAGRTGSGFWVSGPTYPLPGTQTEHWRLGSGAHANTAGGDGVLAPAQQGGARSDVFLYDPLRPVPTLGGNLCCKGDLLPPGAFDQRRIEERDDVLVYTSAPLDRNMAVVGDTRVRLWARTTARDTDFTAKLVDVHPDGYAQNVLDRIVRAKFRRGSKFTPSLIALGRAYEYSFDLGHTATLFKPGHRIRLEVSSSNFPHYARNLNTGRDDGPERSARVAEQTILHSDTYPSRLELPVATGVQPPALAAH